jgi:Domain of unknown function (DUF1788)
VTDQDEFFHRTSLEEAVQALRRDLLAEGGPRISTMRNYRFAILPYRPVDEFKLRKLIRRLSDDLKEEGWCVLSVSLQKLLLDRIRSSGDQELQRLMDRERKLFQKGPALGGPERALDDLRQTIAQHVEGPNGIAADVIKLIDGFAATAPEDVDRTLVLLGRAGALYPFFRSSALLKHIDGKTRNIPVVLLYPGERRDTTALSFMGELPADRDYRPRIYP